MESPFWARNESIAASPETSSNSWFTSCIFQRCKSEAPAPSWWPFADSPVPPESLDAARTRVQALARTLAATPDVQVDVRRGAVPAIIAEVTRDRAAGLLVVSCGGSEHRVGAVAYRIMCEADLPTLVVTGR